MPKLTRNLALASLTIALALAGVACQDARMTCGCAVDRASRVAERLEGQAVSRTALAEMIRTRLMRDGGCTLDPRTGRSVGAVNAYAVSREGYELRLAELPTVPQIAAYLQQHGAALASEPVYVGAWHDDASGAYYLDLSELVTDRTAAEARGRAHGQRCIYHLATGNEIRLR